MKKLMFGSRVLIVVVLLIGLSACFSDDDDEQLPPNDDINGVWRDQRTDSIALISSRGNRVNIPTMSWNEQYEGRIYALDGLIYDSRFGYYATDGELRYSIEYLSGSVVPKFSINVTYDNGKEFNLLYDSSSERPASLDRISGIWSRTSGDYTITYTIDDTGSLFGSDTDGKIYSGRIVAGENDFNIYFVEDFSISDPDGVFSTYLCCLEGQATVIDTVVVDDTLVLVVRRALSTIVEELFRQ